MHITEYETTRLRRNLVKLKILQQIFTAFTGALMAIALVWLVPMASAALNLGGANMTPRVVADTLVAETRVLSYQGRLLNPTTLQPQPDGTYSIKFSLYNVEAGGSALWVETKNVVVSKGLFSSLLGDTAALNLANFNGQNLWLGVQVGTDPEATPRQRVAHAAYALHADVANSALQASFATNAATADSAANASFADYATSTGSAANATLFNGHSYSEFYKETEAVQVTYSLAAGANNYWFSFGYSADQMIYWRVKPSVVGAKMRLEVETELAANNTVTYWLRVYNTGTVNSGYQLIRYHFSQ